MASANNASSSDHGISSHLNPSIIEKLEAGAFRELCRHLQERSDSVQNMDLMTLSGFCRNCLAKVCMFCLYLRMYVYVCVWLTAYGLASVVFESSN